MITKNIISVVPYCRKDSLFHFFIKCYPDKLLTDDEFDFFIYNIKNSPEQVYLTSSFFDHPNNKKLTEQLVPCAEKVNFIIQLGLESFRLKSEIDQILAKGFKISFVFIGEVKCEFYMPYINSMQVEFIYMQNYLFPLKKSALPLDLKNKFKLWIPQKLDADDIFFSSSAAKLLKSKCTTPAIDFCWIKLNSKNLFEPITNTNYKYKFETLIFILFNKFLLFGSNFLSHIFIFFIDILTYGISFFLNYLFWFVKFQYEKRILRIKEGKT